MLFGMEDSRLRVGDKGVSEKTCSLSERDRALGNDPMTASVKKFEFIFESLCNKLNRNQMGTEIKTPRPKRTSEEGTFSLPLRIL
jgi:hypothetical protein